MECRLVNVSSGMNAMYPLREGETSVGRESDNDVQIMRSNISRYHARFLNMSTVCQVKDLDSINGTFVDGERVKTAVLRNGCEVRFADEIYRFETTGSVGAEDVFASERNYSPRTQHDTERILMDTQGTKFINPRSTLPPLSTFPPLRLKPKTDK